MVNLDWEITIGSYRLLMIESVEIIRSVEQLSDTASIVLPGSVFNKSIEVENKIKRGDAVTIKAGYDGNLVTEFTGYLERIETDDGSLTLHCEDGIFTLRKPIADKEMPNATLTSVLDYVLGQAGGYGLECDYQFTYDKFTIRNATAWQVVKKIQEETKANIYLKDNTLHVHPQYRELFGEAAYRFQENIESSQLEYRNAEDRLWQIVVEGKDKAGKVIRKTAGETGGDSEIIKIDGVSNADSLQVMADEHLKTKTYTGYSGSFTGWLMPWCDAGYKVTITDDDYEYKGKDKEKDVYYYVTEVKTTISKEGGQREIKLGMKL